MRIDGTYTFPAPIDQVYAALTHPDTLSQIIPGCERLVQLGPAVGGRPPVYEIRVRRGPGPEVYTLTLILSTLQPPTHLRADLEGHGPDGPISGYGLVDLVQQDSQTLAATVWEMKSPVLAGSSAERRSRWNESAEEFARALRDRVDSTLHSGTSAPGNGRSLTTPRGRVVVLPRGGATLSLEMKGRLKRAAWMAGGVLAGLATIALIAGVVQRLARRRGGSATLSK
ncbi:MAG TPA: hypothetical protein VF040_16900 [Ktedonobacterales bacterium]